MIQAAYSTEEREIWIQNHRFLDSVLRPVFLALENTTVQKLYLFSFSSEGRETSILLGPLERANFHPVTF
jgi:hypothetical protein